MGANVVDYDAWKKGYTPPSEHVLIDQLAYRGARVVMMSDWGETGAFWVVMRGVTPSPAVRKAMREMLDIMFEDAGERDAGQGAEAVRINGDPGPRSSDDTTG